VIYFPARMEKDTRKVKRGLVPTGGFDSHPLCSSGVEMERCEDGMRNKEYMQEAGKLLTGTDIKTRPSNRTTTTTTTSTTTSSTTTATTTTTTTTPTPTTTTTTTTTTTRLLVLYLLLLPSSSSSFSYY
jgi:hypothetical protein